MRWPALAHIPPRGSGGDAEPGGDLGERVTFAQVGQHQQGLPGRGELAPARADPGPVTADDPGNVGEGLARQRQRGTVEKQLESLVSELVLVDRLIYQGLAMLACDTPSRHLTVTGPPRSG